MSDKKSIKAFTIPHEAWYKETVLGGPCIYIGMYYEYGGTDGEFQIIWNDIGILLKAYDDSWAVLSNMPELISLMSRIQTEKLNPTIKEFAGMLKEIGFKDLTKYPIPLTGRQCPLTGSESLHIGETT